MLLFGKCALHCDVASSRLANIGSITLCHLRLGTHSQSCLPRKPAFQTANLELVSWLAS